MTIHEARQRLLIRLYEIYDDREAQSIADWVMEELTGWQKIDRILNKKAPLPVAEMERLENITTQLMAHKPIHYILHQAWFMGMKLYVDEHVLIPRPETEELVQAAVESAKSSQQDLRVLDVGTGSGCIPIALKKKLPQALVSACDISEGALQVAARNAREQNTPVDFLKVDFLDKPAREKLPMFNLIVSNPPYIALQEKQEIDRHVVEYEPHTALFVPDEDALVFYEALADFGRGHLHAGGCMAMEIHYQKGDAVQRLFEAKGYAAAVKKDMQEKDRIVIVKKP